MLLNVAVAVATTLLSATPIPAPYCTPAVFLKSAPVPFGTGAAPLACRVYRLRAPDAPLTLSVATDETDRERGLMFVRGLPEHVGMIFAFPDGDAARVFWMKNTLIPLDMVFIKANGEVGSIARHVPATTESTPDERVPRRGGVGEYVVELNAGEAARDGFEPGVRLHLPALAAQ
jgi:uncharacterized membrane protein (UPF0127 family)